MNKNTNSSNNLISKKKLIEILQKAGIKRISSRALDEINKTIYKELENIAKITKQKLEIKGKKTLKQEDIQEVIKEKENIEYPEI